VQAIWDRWHNGTKLSFEGDFYTHRLMTPMFVPSRSRTARRRSWWPPSEN
jgi:hypothetical protein